MAHSVTSEITKRLMAASLKKQMLSKPLNKITIRDIVDECGLNRQTFYYHFQDIIGLLEYIFNQEVLSIIEDNDNFLSWQEAGIYLLNYLQANSTIMLNALNSLGSPAIQRFLYSDVRNIATRFLTQVASDVEHNDQNFEFLIHFYSNSFCALLEDWLSSGMLRQPEEVIHTLEQIVEGTAKQALERLSESKS